MKLSGVRAKALVFGVCLLTAGCVQSGSGASGDGQSDDEPVVRAVPTVLVADSSASMAENDAPGPRIDAAKQASSALMEALPDGTPTALVAYGANTDDRPESQATSCEDITVLRSLSPLEKGTDVSAGGSTEAAIEGLSPGGFTPIGRALEVAAAELEGADADGEKAIVLISDGEDTCGDPTPCEAARSIKGVQPDVTISTIGFKSDVEELACVARETGGLYLTADNVDQLVSRVVAAQNAPAGEGVLTPTGRSGIELGQSLDDIRSENPDFPGQADGVVEGDLTVIRWMDCDWVFDSTGDLVEIRDNGATTIDGLSVGAPVDQARELYGEPVETTSGGDDRLVQLYPASQEAGTAWKVISDDAGTIRSIVLCGCLPVASGADARFMPLPDGAPDWLSEPGAPAVEILRPVDSAGVVQDGWEVTPSSGVTCDDTYGPQAAAAAVEPGTVQCSGTTASDAGSCWPDATGRNALCLRDPFGSELFSFRSPLLLTGQQPLDKPFAIGAELANGQQCSILRGTGPIIRQGSNTFTSWYGCDEGIIYIDGNIETGGFTPDGTRFTAWFSDDAETLNQVEVTTLVFLGTA